MGHDHDSLRQNVTLDGNVTSYTMSGLVPGHQYNVTLVSESAGQESTSFAQVQMGEFHLGQVCHKLGLCL